MSSVEETSKNFSCSACKREYSSYKTLKQQANRKHPGQANNLAPNIRDSKIYQFKCDLCTYKYNDLYSLRFHMRKMHNVENINESRRKCTLCTYESSKEEMLLHFQEVHDVKIENVELSFIDFEAFNEWKNGTEKETKNKFIVKREATSLQNGEKPHFVCHCSGDYISKGKGLRHLKTQGSNKIDGYYPAEIKVFVSETGACSIKF
ncbi:uncharacterized protein TNCV_4646541 [Trichonephila clavipes]|uniref:C2H2-type domain-containing protein n=1 Tax=Trichonephila clavipes TaxID=2585209 RepID=A0A8X6SWZ0_TRICX|nr:uncharacterized protein TNCV_4646541 [Trichonephila clavipes]